MLLNLGDSAWLAQQRRMTQIADAYVVLQRFWITVSAQESSQPHNVIQLLQSLQPSCIQNSYLW